MSERNHPAPQPAPDDAALAALIARHPAPLRIDASFRLKAPPEKVFAMLGDLEGITRFFPLIHHAAVRHANGCVGAGSERVCSIRGMGKVNERIVWWNAPIGYAYRAQGPLVPLREHLGVIQIAPGAQGGSELTWRQYFHTRLGPLGWMFPFMMRRMMGRAAANIDKLIGAQSDPLGDPNRPSPRLGLPQSHRRA